MTRRRKGEKAASADAPGGCSAVRLDRWLWAARFFKTRSLAAEAATGGHVQVGGRRAKPSHPVRVGDEICVTKGPYRWTVVVEGLSERRGPATEAARLYKEHPESIEERERLREQRRLDPHPFVDPAFKSKGRPSKRDRRRLEDLTGRRR